MTATRTIVVKVGSSTLTSADGGLDREVADSLVAQIAELRREGARVVLVTSGAIAAGLEALGMRERPADMPSLQATAAVGQVQLVGMYAALFASADVPVGQVLLTRNDTADRQAYLHARDTLERLLSLGVVPIVNENDTVAVDEIRFGDNDTLAALVATMIHADLVVLLTDIEGLYSADPREDSEAELLEHIEELTEQIVSAAGGAGTHVGSGGMATKVEAAKVLMRAGIPMVVCDGRRDRVICDAAEGTTVGTKFAGNGSGIKGRKLWIALGGKPAGEVVIDDGAREALVARGKSLLAAGVVSVSGTFEAGDAIVLRDRGGAIVARGITALSSAQIDGVKGMKSEEISKTMPGVAGMEVIHRDQLVIL